MRQMMTLKNLPLADQTFAQIIDFNYIYADKTKYIYKLVCEPKGSYFLSRPRRFGKTLLQHTFHELFTGNRDRFRGLWIDGSDYTFQRHPVIFHSLAFINTKKSYSLEANIVSDLKEIAKKEKLVIDEISPDMYLSKLIQALYKKYDSTVVVLIDEYDAPVTRNMSILKVAEGNAAVINAYFAALKKPEVSPCLRFTFVTGITRYALPSMDSGGNHLNDISLDPEYAGICGFTREEFEALFYDRLETTLSKLINADKMPPTASITDLVAKIYAWYDGYNWGGETRILNPYSILYFFKKQKFDSYWILSGRPGHLTSLIQQKPMDFLQLKLDSYLSEAVKKTDLHDLQIGPVLFHSGYMTLDKETTSLQTNPITGEVSDKTYYSFKLPNSEVADSYSSECFKAIFKVYYQTDFQTFCNKFLEAILARDAQAVSDILIEFFSPIIYQQRLEGEKSFHFLVQVLLSAMGFKVLSEIADCSGRVDLCFELPDQVYLSIEVKYCPIQVTLAEEEKNHALAKAALVFLPDDVDQCLSEAVQAKLDYEAIELLFSESHQILTTKEETNKFLAQEGRKTILTAQEREEALASMVKKKLGEEVIKDVLDNAEAKALKHSKNKIDDMLTKAIKDALEAIAERNYHGVEKLKDKEIIGLGLVISGYGSQVNAAFGPVGSKASPRSKGRSKGV
jgi:hypothetical protein